MKELLMEDTVRFCERHGIDAFLAVDRDSHGRGGE